MIYKLASRDNIDSEKFETWPAVLMKGFTKFNNRVEEFTFCSEDELMCWLESRSRTKSTSRHTNIQEFRNGDPNKLYSVYCCEHENPTHDQTDPYLYDNFLYSLRFKKPHETFMTFTNEKGSRVTSSFKKINIQNQIRESVDHSSDIREIKNELFEGIYPIDVDSNDAMSVKYIEYVKRIHITDTEENKNKDFSIVCSSNCHNSRWLENFLKILSRVEKYLEFFAKGGDIYVNLSKDDEHIELTERIINLINDNAQEDDEVHNKIKNLAKDPLLFNGEIYQVRFDKTLLTWHKNYSYIIKKYNLIPSEQFSELILHFNFSDFFKQIQSKENLQAMLKNIEDMYGIHKSFNDVKYNPWKNNDIVFVKGRTVQPKFHKITKTFD